MSNIFNPTGLLNVSTDASDLPGARDQFSETSEALTRAKNVRLDGGGKAVTRDGSAKINATAIQTAIWWIEEQSGNRYTFSGTDIYENEVSLSQSVTSAQWSAIQYNAFNDTAKNIYALNGTDRKRIESSTVYEWGIAAPTAEPVLGVGSGAGLTGQYNVKYTYARKSGSTLIAESNGSPEADNGQVLTNQSLSVDVDSTPSDAQVTHIRIYRTLDGGEEFFLDKELAVSGAYAYGYAHDWEESQGYISGTGYDFTVTDDIHGTENTETWERVFETHDDESSSSPDDDYALNRDPDYKSYW